MLEVRRGDDLNAFGKEVVVTLNTERDLISCRAVFELDGFRQEWDDVTSKRLLLVMTREDTYKLKVGQRFGHVKIYDQNNLAETVEKEISVFVHPEVVKNEQ